MSFQGCCVFRKEFDLVLILIQHDKKIRKPSKTLYVRISTVSRGSARMYVFDIQLYFCVSMYFFAANEYCLTCLLIDHDLNTP